MRAALIERVRVVRARRRAAFAAALAEHPAQRLRELHRFRIAQRHDVHVARHTARRVELLRDLLRRGEALRVRCAQQQRIGSRIGLHGDFQRRVGVADRARVEQLRQLRGDVDRIRILERHDGDLRARRAVDARDDLRDPAHVVRVIGDDDRVVGRIRGDRVVRRDQRAQHRKQVVRRFVAQLEHLRDHLVAAHLRRVADVGRHALQLRVGFRHDLQDAVILDEREALHTQRGLQRLQRLIFGHRTLGDEVQLPLDARIDDDRLARRGADRLGDLIDVRIDEIERDLSVSGLRGDNSGDNERRCDAPQSKASSCHGVMDRCRRRPFPMVLRKVRIKKQTLAVFHVRNITLNRELSHFRHKNRQRMPHVSFHMRSFGKHRHDNAV
ncbi:general Secretory Pathway D, type II secretion system domain protein [Burkholderia mallei]|nr:general Secretory Pathway D, type II secretion system domain protein [Burkholderia mallei]